MTENVSSEVGQATTTATETSANIGQRDSIAAETAPASEGNTFNIPEQYQEQKWASNIKSIDSLWENHANAQSLIGKKTIGVPTEESTPEELTEYYSKLRPENVEGYGLEGLSEQELDVYGNAFHENGITKQQAQSILSKHNEYVENQKVEMYSQEGLDSIVKKVFAGDEQGLESVKSNLREVLSDEQKQMVDTVPNQFLELFYQAQYQTLKKHGANEGNSLINASDKMAMTETQLGEKRNALRDKLGQIKTRPHEKGEYNKVLNELSATYKGVK